MRFRLDDREEINRILAGLTPPSLAEPGCATYIPLWVEGEDATLVIWEQYADQAAVEAHRASEHFAQFAVGGLYQKMLEREVENLSPAA